MVERERETERKDTENKNRWVEMVFTTTFFFFFFRRRRLLLLFLFRLLLLLLHFHRRRFYSSVELFLLSARLAAYVNHYTFISVCGRQSIWTWPRMCNVILCVCVCALCTGKSAFSLIQKLHVIQKNETW